MEDRLPSLEDFLSMKYRVESSPIHGIGVFASRDLPKGEIVGKLHDIKGNTYEFTELGRSHNHSDEPNCKNVMVDSTRYLETLRDVKAGEELTADYRLQPDLEQPENFSS